MSGIRESALPTDSLLLQPIMMMMMMMMIITIIYFKLFYNAVTNPKHLAWNDRAISE